jgi:hypothetical protein
MSARRTIGLMALVLLTSSACKAPPAARLAVAPLPAAGAAAQDPPAAAATALGPSTPAAKAPPAPQPLPGLAIARLAAGTDAKALLARPALAGFRASGSVALSGHTYVRLQLPAGLAFAAARARLATVAGLEDLQPDLQLRRHAFAFTQADPRLAAQWAHRPDRANTDGAWSLVPASRQGKVIAAVIDTGLDVGHPEFAGRVVGARSYDPYKADPTDVTDAVGHGTHVAGIIGAAGNNGVGVAGVAWGVKLMPLQFANDVFSTVQALSDAVAYRPVPDDGSRVRVVNMSLGFGSGGTNALFVDAIEQARQAGVTVVVSAGNDGAETMEVPASTPGAVSVGSTSESFVWERLSTFSNKDPNLLLVAPGEHIFSTFPQAGASDDASTSGYAYLSGTSMSAPYVAGVVALIVARYDPDHANANAAFTDKVRARLAAACDDLGLPGPDPEYGAGRINAARAVTPATIDAAP